MSVIMLLAFLLGGERLAVHTAVERGVVRPSRWPLIGGILFVAIAAIWILVRGAGISEITQIALLETYIDYVLLLLLGAVLALVILVYTRQLKQEQAGRDQAERALQRQRSYLNALFHTAHQLNFEPNLQSVLQSICGEAAIALDVEAATIALYRPERGVTELVAGYGLPNALLEQFRTFPYPASAALQGGPHDAPLVFSLDKRDLKSLPHSDLYRAVDFKTAFYVPLRDHERYLGAFSALARDPRARLIPEDAALLKAFAAQASLAIKSDRLAAETRETHGKLETLRAGDVAILSSLDLNLTLKVFLQQVIDQLKADAADVLLLNPSSQILEYAAGIGFLTGALKASRVLLGTGFAGKVALDRRTLYVADVNAAAPFTRRDLILGEGVASYFGCPLIAKGQVRGVLEVFHRQPFQPDEKWLSFLETLAGQAAIAIDNAWLFSNVQQMNVQLALAYDRTLEGWSRALDLRDRETEGHTQRVAELSLRLAKALNVHENDLVHLRRGALLHDIGKMGIPDEVLHKPGDFTQEDQQVMEKHPTLALEMLSPISYLQGALDIPYCHHERWDGTGYPRGLRGEVIPMAARIFAVADVWDALTTDRPYRKALSKTGALQYVREQAGKQFDPAIVEAFLKVVA